MFKTGRTSGTVTGSVVDLGELLDARKLDEGEVGTAAELGFEAGDEVRVDELLGRLESVTGIDLVVDADLVVERVRTVDQDKDVVLGFSRAWAAKALATDTDIVELGLGDDGDTGVDVDPEIFEIRVGSLY
jgi:hypothetical protein